MDTDLLQRIVAYLEYVALLCASCLIDRIERHTIDPTSQSVLTKPDYASTRCCTQSYTRELSSIIQRLQFEILFSRVSPLRRAHKHERTPLYTLLRVFINSPSFQLHFPFWKLQCAEWVCASSFRRSNVFDCDELSMQQFLAQTTHNHTWCGVDKLSARTFRSTEFSVTSVTPATVTFIISTKTANDGRAILWFCKKTNMSSKILLLFEPAQLRSTHSLCKIIAKGKYSTGTTNRLCSSKVVLAFSTDNTKETTGRPKSLINQAFFIIWFTKLRTAMQKANRFIAIPWIVGKYTCNKMFV